MAVAQALEPSPARPTPELGRGRLLVACAYDLATLLIGMLASSLVSITWMLARTGWGRLDLETGDAVIALAIAVSAGPAWTAWQWLHLRDDGGTFGRRHLHTVDTLQREARNGPTQRLRRTVWFILHPVSLPLWAWLTTVLVATGSPPFIFVSSAPLTAAMATALLAVISLLSMLVRPSLPPLHVWIARASFGGRR